MLKRPKYMIQGEREGEILKWVHGIGCQCLAHMDSLVPLRQGEFRGQAELSFYLQTMPGNSVVPMGDFTAWAQPPLVLTQLWPCAWKGIGLAFISSNED